MVEAKNVSREYREGSISVLAVDSVCLSMKKGEVLLIMGPSGSGKTTLISMMGCILHPTGGEVVVDGRSVTALHEDALPDIRKRYFGFVFQSFNLFPSLTAAENVEAILRFKGWNKGDFSMQARHLLEKVRLEHRKDFYPRDLSGGEKQKVAFARALAGDPPVILADEPTANLDSKNATEVLSLLKGLAEGFGKAVAIVSHDPKAEAFAHRVVFMEDGRLSV
ncbi:MAG: ABC transporter ATP-binding protein [Nitrospirae bacterium]|nr:ABC transporter ATP-binding protein [Nitrospirota bacterium]